MLSDNTDTILVIWPPFLLTIQRLLLLHARPYQMLCIYWLICFSKQLIRQRYPHLINEETQYREGNFHTSHNYKVAMLILEHRQYNYFNCLSFSICQNLCRDVCMHYLILSTSVWCRCYGPHFTDRGTKS